MKKIYFYLFILTLLYSCNNSKNDIVQNKVTSKRIENYKEIFTEPDEEPPYFIGEPNAWKEFITKEYNIQNKEEISKKIIISFIVLKDGSLSNIKIRKSISKKADKEAIRVIKLMPKWKPGKIDGKIVEMKVLLPILIGGYK